MHKRFRQRGLTLIEIAAGLTLMAIVSAGALAIADSTRSSQLSSTLASNLTSIRQSARLVKQATGTYGTASLNATLITAKRVPLDMAVSGTTISNSYGGTVTITGATSTFSIVATAIPRSACIALLTSADAGWVSAKVDSAAAITSFPISPTTATGSTLCGGTPTSYTLTFVAS